MHTYNAGAVLGQGADAGLCCKPSWPGRGCFRRQSCRKANLCSIHQLTSCCLVVSSCLSSLRPFQETSSLFRPCKHCSAVCSHGSPQGWCLGCRQGLQGGGDGMFRGGHREKYFVVEHQACKNTGRTMCSLRSIPVCVHMYKHLHVCPCTSKLLPLAAPHSG